jgi:prolyl-tRNA synthetase
LKALNFELADMEIVIASTSAQVGFAGPLGLKADELIVDFEILSMDNMVVGANDTGYHYINVNYGRDFEGTIGDFRNVTEGEKCPHCGKPVTIKRGIEVGHIFKLGTKYSDSLGAKFVQENGELEPVIMGCYGIGINRTMAAVIEQNYDEKGIKWPVSVAPYQVIVIPAVMKDELQVKTALEIYDKLNALGVEILIDDRDERAGVKFNDADLIGIPVRVTVGKKIKEGNVEFKLRNEETARDISIEDVCDEVLSAIK